jgi:hypothetical protein
MSRALDNSQFRSAIGSLDELTSGALRNDRIILTMDHHEALGGKQRRSTKRVQRHNVIHESGWVKQRFFTDHAGSSTRRCEVFFGTAPSSEIIWCGQSSYGPNALILGTDSKC